MTRNIGQHYSDVWKAYFAEMERHAVAIAGACELEQQHGCDMLNRDLLVLDKDDSDPFEEIKKKGEKIFERLVWYAERAFAPSGSRLQLNDKDLHSKLIGKFADRGCGEDYDKYKKRALNGWRKFDPEAIWAKLEAMYGGDNGKELGYRQTAAELARFFDLKQGTRVETKSGSVVLNARIYSERRYGGKMELDYHSTDKVYKGLTNLATMAEWAEDDESAVRLRQSVHRFCRNHEVGINSRERFDVSENTELVTYFNRFEFRFTPAFAAKLQEFVATYGNLEKSAA